jgi:hypothetical protein
MAPQLPQGGRKTQTHARDLKPRRANHQTPIPRAEQAHAGAADALARGRRDALDATAVLHLQKTAGNATVSAAIEKGTPHVDAPHLSKGASNVSSLFASEAPALVPLISAEQLKALQEPYNVRAHNADVKRRYNALKKRREHDEYPMDQAWDRRLDQVWSELQPEPTGADQVTVPTASVLDPAILDVPVGDEEAEAGFRKSVFGELSKTPMVTVRVADRMLSALERGDDGPYTKPEVLLECGNVKLPHTKGRVTFADLTAKRGSPYARRYRDQVTNRAEVAALRNELIDLEAALTDAEAEHQDLQARGKTHPVVKATAEFLGGPSISEISEVIIDAKNHPEKGTLEARLAELEAPEPPLDIWREPKLHAKQAQELLHKREVTLASLGLVRAQHSAAIAFGAYQRYEQRVMKGAGIAKKWLERAKEAGKLAVEVAAAEAGLGALAKAGLSSAYGFIQAEAGREEGKSHWDLAKDAGVEAAMSFVGDRFKDGFKDALKERFAAHLKAYPSLAHHVIESTAGMSASFYKTPMEAVTKHIIAGGKMPKDTKEWADMIAKESLTEAAAGASGSELHQAMTKFVIKLTGSEPEEGKESGKGAD